MVFTVQKARVLWMMFAALLLLGSCAHNESRMIGTDAEVWDMQVSGGTCAEYQVLMIRTENQRDIYTVRGEFSGMANDRTGGRGMVMCDFFGKIARDDLRAEFTGTGDMVRGSVFINGSFWGTLSDTEGRGNYQLSHQEGQSDGEWIMKRIKASNQK